MWIETIEGGVDMLVTMFPRAFVVASMLSGVIWSTPASNYPNVQQLAGHVINVGSHKVAGTNAIPSQQDVFVTITAVDASASEARHATGTFTVTRYPERNDSALTVSYSIGGSATNGVDYDSISSSVTIPIGQNSADITIRPRADSKIEGDETVTLTLVSGSGYELGAPLEATITIADNTPSSVPVGIYTWEPTASEQGPTDGLFFVVRGGDDSTALTVNYSIGGTATNGVDYELISSQVTIPAGQYFAAIRITPITDNEKEGYESVTLTLVPSPTYQTFPVLNFDSLAITDVPVRPVTATFLGKVRDRVGTGNSAVAPDGYMDGVFSYTLPAGYAVKTITSMRLTRAKGGVWDTDPSTLSWIMGVADSTDGQLRNNVDGSVSVSGTTTLTVFVSDNGGLFSSGDSFDLNLNFSNGTSTFITLGFNTPQLMSPKLMFDGRLRDKVGRGKTSLIADGSGDGTFTVSFAPDTGSRTIVAMTLTRSDGGTWDTNPDSSLWVIGVADSLDGTLQNNPQGGLSIPINSDSTLKLFTSDNFGLFEPGAQFKLTVTFGDGLEVNAEASVPGTGSPQLAYIGRSADRVGRGKDQLGPDGDSDGVFEVSFPAGTASSEITGITLERTDGGTWDTNPSTSMWVVGVADKLDTELRNGPQGAIAISVTEGNKLMLFVSDNVGLFEVGSQFKLTIQFADGSTQVASTTIAPSSH